MNRLRSYFLAGLLVLTPAALSLWVFWILFHKVDNILGGIFTRLTHHHIYGLGFITMVLVVLGLGVLASNYLGRRLVDWGDQAMGHLPGVSRVYGAMKQISEVFLTEKTRGFRRVVLIEFPRPGVWSFGFVTAEAEVALDIGRPERVIHVFVPHVPNPTGGFLLIVREADTQPLDITLDEAIKLVVSMGAVVPSGQAPAHRGTESPVP